VTSWTLWGLACYGIPARRGEIEFLISVTLLAHHLILFAREASAGRRNASNYSAKPIEEVLVAAE